MSLDAVDEPKEAEEVTPVAQQEPEHVAVSESSAASEAVFTPVEDVSSNASTTIEEAQEEMQEIRLVTPAPTPAATHASSARVATDAPSPARAFVFGAPASPQPKQAQTPAKEDAPVQDAATFAFTFASPMRLTTRLADNFAPTQQQAPTSSTSSHAAVFEEMQRRIGLGAPSDHAGGNTHGEISLFSLGGTSHAGDFSFGAPQPSSAPRFGNAHEREFARMDSITTHYAARRRALEAQASAKSGAGVPHTSTPNARAHANRRSRGNLAAKSSPSGKFRNKPRAFGTSSSSSTATTGADRPLFSPIKPALTSSVSSSALSRPLNELAACSDGTLKRSASAKSASLAASLSKFHQAGAGGGSASSRMASALKDGGWAGGSGSTAASSRGKHATSSKSTVTGSSRGAAVASGSTSEFGALKRPVNDRKPSTASTNGKARKSTGFVRGTRRKSMTIGRQRPSAAGIGKRKSTVPVPPVPKLPNKLSSSVASTSKAGDKRASTEASKPAKSAFARAFGGSTRERPAVASTATAKPTTSSSGPAWKKFDLKESLRRPLGYKPKLGEPLLPCPVLKVGADVWRQVACRPPHQRALSRARTRIARHRRPPSDLRRPPQARTRRRSRLPAVSSLRAEATTPLPRSDLSRSARRR